MYLLVGLGNPGRQYCETRHNAGFLVLDEILAKECGQPWSSKKFESEWSRCQILGEDCLFLKPQTYMNLSGRAVAQALKFYKAKAEKVIVLHDDIDVPLGKVKLRMGGGNGGHNGIKSLQLELGTSNFARIKLGVGRPPESVPPVVDWVLGRFSRDELGLVRGQMVRETVERLEGLFRQTQTESP